jgi:Ternary complex associated domain 9
MHIGFPDVGFPKECRGEIDAVLQRIAVGEAPGHWREQPYTIQILRRLAGGRSGSEVLDVIVKRGNHEARKVIKLGPGHDLANEFQAFRTHLPNPSALFVPIEAATPSVLGKTPIQRGRREAVVYDYAARFVGDARSEIRTFEDLAHEAIQKGDETLDKAVTLIEVLFRGVQNDLYEKYNIDDRKTILKDWWNHRLGIDAIIAINRVNVRQHMLEMAANNFYRVKQKTLQPLDIVEESIRVDGKTIIGSLVELDEAKMKWRDRHLIAEVDAHHLRVEVVAQGEAAIDQLASTVKDGSVWMLRGRLVSLRMLEHRERLLKGLGDEFEIIGSILSGPGARVQDPFIALPKVLEIPRTPRITSVIHGDLNPRNILVIEGTPCVIDYALTCRGEPILIDFTRLEGSLAREALPDDLTWIQHVRLQRLLAAACRLGDGAAQRFTRRLAAERLELASAFWLLWSIRQAAREAYPLHLRDQWVRDYLEQLFLFAHLTLKWNSEEDLATKKLLAMASIAGVAVEALSDMHIYDLWSEEALRGDGGEIIKIVALQSEISLNELANLASVIQRLDPQRDYALKQAFRQARASFVKQQFSKDAYVVIDQLAHDHDVYISLKAYIDLEGQLNAPFRQQQRSLEEMLEIDELLSEGERLRARSNSGEDVLRLVSENPVVVLIGDAGSGKSTVAREWEYRLARSIVDQNKSLYDSEPIKGQSRLVHSEQPLEVQNGSRRAVEPRMPIILRAPDLADLLQHMKGRELGSPEVVLGSDERTINLLTIGTHYVIVDALNELAEEQKRRVVNWIIALHELYPNIPILVCHRQYNYVPGLLPFPVITLQKVKIEQARNYIQNYLREYGVSDHDQLAQRLINLLLDDPEHAQVRDLAQTPLFLWMIVEQYRQSREVPTSRGSLFEIFSRWYLEQRYHMVHQELAKTHYPYEDKALLLGALGYELVQRRKIQLPEEEIPHLVPEDIKDRWYSVLEEIIAAEMLYRNGKYLRFLHQSFQEYFAACHFLATGTSDQVALRQKVRQFGWHDTFAVLLGFAGDETEVVTQVIEEALKVNSVLTARFLRMAEQPDPRLINRFVTTQEAILQNARSGEFSHKRAAEALAEHGREESRAALWRIVLNAKAPETSRVAALNSLATMPSQVRFELMVGQILQELLNHLPYIFNEPAPIVVQQAALNTIVIAHLKDLGAYLADLVASGEWPLRKAAWEACGRLGLKLTPRQQAAFDTACRERLSQLEEELFQETVETDIRELNVERVDILYRLAKPAHLPLLLKRRFSFFIYDKVEEIVDQVIDNGGGPPVEAQDAWGILTERTRVATNAINRWLKLLVGPDELVAIAAAHRLIKYAREIPGPKLYPLFDPSLPPSRLSAIARLTEACRSIWSIILLEALLRSFMKNVTGREAFEALANLTEVLTKLDSSLGNRVAAVANTIFFTSGNKAKHHRYFPWAIVSADTQLQVSDYDTLINAGGDDARAAIFELSSYSGAMLLEADKNVHPITQPSYHNSVSWSLRKLAQSEQEPAWQYNIALAAVTSKAVSLLPWLVNLARNSEMAETKTATYDPRYGAYEECFLANILRAIGYLARVLLDQHDTKAGKTEMDFFHTYYASLESNEELSNIVGLTTGIRSLYARYASLEPNEERSIIVGLTTGLGYLGGWEPILTHLGSGEPWMHQAAMNVFSYWFPSPLKIASAEKQHEEAVIWIIRRLQNRSDLAPQVRSTLEQIKERLEWRLGRYVDTGE